MASTLVAYVKQFSKASAAFYRLQDAKGNVSEPEAYHQQLDRDCALWDQDIGTMLYKMLKMSEYKEPATAVHTDFFKSSVTQFLGCYPQHKKDVSHAWKSFMTDDHTPVELSWSWSSSDGVTPAVRYSVEPISRSAYQGNDTVNTTANVRMLGEALVLAPNMDLALHKHFRDSLISYNRCTLGQDEKLSQVPHSQCFIAFDLHDHDMVVKQYYLPGRRALQESCSNWKLVKTSIQNVPQTASGLLDSFGVLVEFMESFPVESQPIVEILAIDCLDPAQSRLKVYVRSRETTFHSVVDMLTLGGRTIMSHEARDALHELWLAVFGLSPDHRNIDMKLHASTTHRTGGILYYYELKSGMRFPKTKVYLPVRHYAQNDDQIALGLSRFLESRGKSLSTGPYYQAVQDLCKHRNLADGLGFHTYVSWASDGTAWNVTTYFNPQSYSR